MEQMTFASSAPEVTAAHLAAKTKNIRIGTGGVMMMHYSPLKLAEVFKTLSAFSPGRIDFGVGRAPGGDNYSIYALSEGRQPMLNNMYEKFDTALQLINDEVPEDGLYNKTIATPSHVICQKLGCWVRVEIVLFKQGEGALAILLHSFSMVR